MNANGLSGAILLSVLVPVALTGQGVREHDPVALKNWAAPLYWQASRGELRSPDGTVPTPAPLATGSSLPLGNNALVFVAMTPCRVVDTRSGQGFTGGFGPPSIGGGLPVRTIPIQSSGTCSIPSLAQAYSFNVTVVPPGPLIYLTLYPATAGTQPAPPNASTLNAPLGNIVANAAIVPAGTDGHGGVDVYASGPTDLIIDINGYYSSPTDLGNNTGLGVGALASNTSGSDNTANGAVALTSNTTGSDNTATGAGALLANTTGGNNTASGFGALTNNTTGSSNTATGVAALESNTLGGNNTAEGFAALTSNTTGGYNTASGFLALQHNTTGIDNTASGAGSLSTNTTGNSNIAIGYNAAMSVAAGNSNNIHIGSQGASGDGGAIRIGAPGPQTSFFAAGIRGVTTGSNNAVAVVIDSNGQLGTVNSSRRFKEDIQDMGAASSGLLRLRPVTFRYKRPFADGSKPMEYGLIAEEVEEVYPDLVAHSADGQIESVKYQVLDSMLLNEVKKLAEENRALKERLAAVEAAIEKRQ